MKPVSVECLCAALAKKGFKGLAAGTNMLIIKIVSLPLMHIAASPIVPHPSHLCIVYFLFTTV